MSVFKKFGKWVGKTADKVKGVALPLIGVAAGLALPGVGGVIGKAIGSVGQKLKIGKNQLDTLKKEANEKTGGLFGIGDGKAGIFGIGTGKSRQSRIQRDDELREQYEREKAVAAANGLPMPPPPAGLSGLPGWVKAAGAGLVAMLLLKK